MPKLGPIFLLATTIITLLCFGVLCYLMRTVNPKVIPENARRYSAQNIPYLEELSQSGNLEYGLEKVPETDTTKDIKIYTKSDTRSLAPGNDIIVPSISPKSANISQAGQNVKPNQTNSVLSHIKGQRRSIKDEDSLIKIPNSFILNLRDHDGPKIIIQLSAESANKRGERSSSKRRINNKTVVVLEVNDSIILNVIGNTIDENNLDDMEPNFAKHLDLGNTAYNNLSDDQTNLINSTAISEENIPSSDITQSTSSMLYNDTTEFNTIDGIEYNPTYTLTEKFNFIDTTDSIKLDKTKTVITDLVADLLQGETLKDIPPRNKNMYENVS